MGSLSFSPYPEANDDGLVYGVETVLAARRPNAPRPYLARGEDARAFLLLSIAAGRPAQADTLRFLRRALDQWDRGEKALAQFELAFARFPRLRTRDDAWPLFWADALIAGGVSPAMLLQKLGLASDAASVIRYAADEPRVPAGHGRQSGEWTSGDYGARPHPAGRDYAQNSRGPTGPRQYLPVGEGGGGRVGGGGANAEPAPATNEPVKAFEVGPSNELRARSMPYDDLEVHHAIQAHPAKQVYPGYNRSAAPAIAIPGAQHRDVPRLTGVYDGTARDLLARDINNLRKHTDAPRDALQKLIQLNKTMYPGLFSK